MSEPFDTEPGAEPATTPEHPDDEAVLQAGDEELARWVSGQRPVPAADFRGRLGRRLRTDDPGYGPRPEKLRRTASLYLASGGMLLAAGVLAATGVL